MLTAIPNAPALEAAAKIAGLTLTAAEPGTTFTGETTVRAMMTLAGSQPEAPVKTLMLELSPGFDASNAAYAAELETFFAETAQRLRNPEPEAYMTLLGLPLRFRGFGWPFHGSTSGADTFIVHGTIYLADGSVVEGTAAPLQAKVSAALTQTFAEVISAQEQPVAEGFIFNAVRKTLDQGQLEMVKSGNRQPVPVTTRYYSVKQQKFIFNDTSAEQRADFLKAKTFWLSAKLGGGAPVWITDPRDAQYLNTTVAELKANAQALAAKGLIILSENDDMAAASHALLGMEDEFRAKVAEALLFIKPAFNEDMRAGNTNM